MATGDFYSSLVFASANSTLAGQLAGYYQSQNQLSSYNQDQQGSIYQWKALDHSPKKVVATTPKRTIERLRDEIKDWHGNILERNK